MKHSIFRSKVQDAGIKKHKRRRPGKKLVTNLGSLEDALEDVDVDGDGIGGKTRMKNVREGRGQAKRKEKVVKEERERFGKNMAILSASGQSQGTKDAGAGSKWSALRAHIQAGMPEAVTNTG
jgi:hypothetical protein